MSEQSTTYLVRAFLIVLVIGCVVGAWMLEDYLATPKEVVEEPAAEDAKENGIIRTRDQAAGSSVVVDTENMPEADVWVAVHEMRAGELSNVLGAARVLPSQSWISIPLLRNTMSGASYAVVLYRDDGDRSFDHYKDSIYVDYDSGERVVSLFKAI